MSNHPNPKDINLSYCRKVVEQARVGEIMDILKSLKSAELAIISRSIDIRLGKPKLITRTLTELCLNRVRNYGLFKEFELFSTVISKDPLSFCENRLKDSFADPSRQQINDLLPELIQKFGLLRTQFLFAACIDGEQNVAEIAKDLFSTHGELAFLSIEEPSDQSVHTLLSHVVSPELKQSRRAKKMIEREERATAKEQQEKAKEDSKHANERRQILRKMVRNTVDLATIDQVTVDTAESGADFTPQIVKRLHPHISRFQDADITDANVGKIGMAFIWFTGSTRGAGKTRPVLIIAKTKKYYIVRPIYSNARRPAGSWRAVVINEWQTANLSNPSFVGDEIHKIKIDRLRIIGGLTITDWNRVCLGEVNSD
jgi:hypothetical protein